jgi:hypothetical protein
MRKRPHAIFSLLNCIEHFSIVCVFAVAIRDRIHQTELESEPRNRLRLVLVTDERHRVQVD